jgi:two-component system, OmpR family, response regulator CpxR
MPVRKNSSTTSHSSPGSILLVDDNKLGLSARRCVLEELGHRIATAANGVDALEQFEAGKFDLVVTDYKMPKMDGRELIIKLRKLSPELPVIMISGFVDALGLSEENTGADVVIQKSSNEVSHMVRSVGRLLRRKPAVKKPARSEGSTAERKKKTS